MIITIFGATGLAGKYLVKQALANGHIVKAFGRNVTTLIDEDLQNDNLQIIKGYVFEPEDVYTAIKGSDAVLSALGGSFDGKNKTRSLGIKNIIEQMKKANIRRIIAVGGLGILNKDENSLLIDAEDYPQQFIPVGKEHLQAYLFLKESGLGWTIIGAPDIKNADATGQYVTSADYLPQPNKSHINAGDIADFMLKELKENKYIQKRVGISNV